ncbi:uncharacterized protein LDX57_006841 [Aspergillus melleus]|uniref:uncharacterized protein n=1 Tax=Aspergillus melleus TaxID=138277 RepID=UPI001E8ED7FE|nr:uncharacterized protein LDX57_006841 [Aspergillus melleus]KAH8429172.1 hypothetical protein LDX57_006841 [Aspergillus melleus]
MAVIAVMGAGVFAAAATLTKAILLKNLPAHADITWSWAPITLWYTIEMYVIIICATLPTLRQSYFAVLNRSTHQSSSYNKFTHSGKSDHKQRSLPQPRRPVDASLFETHMTNFQEEPGHQHSSSQENILPGEAIDLSAIKKTTEVHVYQEKDHLLALREDPGYFADVVNDYKEQLQEILRDTNGKPHVTMAQYPPSVFWNRDLQNVVTAAYFAIEICDSVRGALSNLRQLQSKYEGRIFPEKDLPKGLYDKFVKVRYSPEQSTIGPIN